MSLNLSKRPATYTEMRKYAKKEGLGWFASRVYAILGVLGGTQVITINVDDIRRIGGERLNQTESRPGT